MTEGGTREDLSRPRSSDRGVATRRLPVPACPAGSRGSCRRSQPPRAISVLVGAPSPGSLVRPRTAGASGRSSLPGALQLSAVSELPSHCS